MRVLAIVSLLFMFVSCGTIDQRSYVRGCVDGTTTVVVGFFGEIQKPEEIARLCIDNLAVRLIAEKLLPLKVVREERADLLDDRD